MHGKKDYKYIRLIIIDIFAALILWALLIVLRGCGVIDLHWALTLSSLLFISWGLFALTALLELTVYLVCWAFAKADAQIIKNKLRKTTHLKINLERLAADYGIVRRNGETDEHLLIRVFAKVRKEHAPPIKDLDEEAWNDFKIVRRIGETDEHLAARCMHAATVELLNDLEKEPEE